MRISDWSSDVCSSDLDLLRAHEFVAEPVRDGRDAVERARAFAPDLIVMDIQMPHVSGYELIGELKLDEALCRVPIMAVTAYAGREDEERIRAAGDRKSTRLNSSH